MTFSLENLPSIYLTSAIAGTVVFLLKTFLPIDSGTEVSGDFNSFADSDASFSLLTIEGISAFFMAAGWMGWYALTVRGYTAPASTAVAIASGFLAMAFFAWLLSKFKKLEHVPTRDINTLIDKTGKAYLQFPPKGSGKIQIDFLGKLDVLDAYNDSDEEIKSFEPIKVVRVEDDKIFVVKV